MFVEGKEIFIHFAGSGKTRVLHPMAVIGHTESGDMLRFADALHRPPVPAPGTPIAVYFQGKHEFMQQPGEIAAVREEETGPLLELHTLSEPVSAESRKCFRVSTVMAEYHADFGPMGTRKIVDVSTTGLAFITSHELSLGDIVGIKFSHSKRGYDGVGFVQSHKEVRQGHRYGLLCTEDGSTGLTKGLQMLTMDAQRAHLRRFSGNA